jgi:diaminohydroxyphosphoribosylaminopyrimidine deaminase/5-amino-6-(5-phosphoribosylamino)uracil reductase
MNAKRHDRPPDDRAWMRRAIALARLSEGHTRPNPPVGAVVVRGGRKLGEGRHRCAGGAHAEVEAFNACREPVRGATLYVTLEPCSTHGRTPPCTGRILEEGIARVVVGCRDENVRHGGRGLALLAERGVEVVCGVCEAEAREIALPFFKHIATGLPFVTLKLAMTLDGRIADRAHRSQWITGEAARAEVQRMRRRADAVLVGAGTVCADDPSLLCRVRGGGELLRVVVDASGRSPAGARVFTDEAAARTVVATASCGAAARAAAWTRRGAQVWPFAADKAGRVPLKRLLKKLGGAGCLHVLCEGGGQLAGALHDAGLVDEYAFFYAPAVLGDAHALSGVSGCGTLLAGVQRLHVKRVQRFGEDVLIRSRRL